MPTFYSDDLADKNRVDPHFCDDNEMKHFQHNDSDVYVKHRWFFYSLESSELTCPTLWFSTVCCSLSGVFGFSELVEKLQLKPFRQQKLPCSREVCSPPLKGSRSKSSEENICWKQSVFIFSCLVTTWIAAVCRAGPSPQRHLEIRYKLLIPVHTIDNVSESDSKQDQ